MTDPRTAAMAEALWHPLDHDDHTHCIAWADAPDDEKAICYEEAAAILAALPPDWCGHGGHHIGPECGPICWTTGHHHDPEACDGCRRLMDLAYSARAALEDPR